MTREEAKTWLIKLYARADITDEYGDMEDMQPYEEAVNMSIKALEQELSGDLISRDAVIDIIHLFFTEEIDKIPTKKTEDGEVYVIHKCQPLFEMNKAICKRIKALPSVTAEPKTGHWIDIMVGDMPAQACDQCNTFYPLAYTGGGHNYCPNCGAKMQIEG